MLDPADFLRVANELVANATGSDRRGPLAAARARTAIGRAYYAVFLLMRAELVRRHRLRDVQHGALYMHLQSSRSTDELRQVGRELERLYTMRQKADYDLNPAPYWRDHVENPAAARILLRSADALARIIPRLDLSPVVPLLDPRTAGGHAP